MPKKLEGLSFGRGGEHHPQFDNEESPMHSGNKYIGSILDKYHRIVELVKSSMQIMNTVETDQQTIDSLASVISTELGYGPCTSCTKHPMYPEIPPQTLHRGGVCLICGKSEVRILSIS